MPCPATESSVSTEADLAIQIQERKSIYTANGRACLLYHLWQTDGAVPWVHFAVLPIGIASERQPLSPFLTISERKTFMAFPACTVLLFQWPLTFMLQGKFAPSCLRN